MGLTSSNLHVLTTVVARPAVLVQTQAGINVTRTHKHITQPQSHYTDTGLFSPLLVL